MNRSSTSWRHPLAAALLLVVPLAGCGGGATMAEPDAPASAETPASSEPSSPADDSPTTTAAGELPPTKMAPLPAPARYADVRACAALTQERAAEILGGPAAWANAVEPETRDGGVVYTSCRYRLAADAANSITLVHLDAPDEGARQTVMRSSINITGSTDASGIAPGARWVETPDRVLLVPLPAGGARITITETPRHPLGNEQFATAWRVLAPVLT